MPVMNNKRKILTLLALVVFGAIIAGHYMDVHDAGGYFVTDPHRYVPVYRAALVDDIRMPLFVLAVLYVGLFSIFGDKKD
jgi:hypothetical protein